MDTEQKPQRRDLRVDIVKEISNLSRALGEIKSDECSVEEARDTLLKLSLLIGEEMDIKW